MRLKLARTGAGLLVAAIAATVTAAELLSARIVSEDGETVVFHLKGESREEVIGGAIEFGPRSFVITNLSRRGLIGARRDGTGDNGVPFVEYAVFSSSFSMQTAVGHPWASALSYVGCESPYNSFLAIYHVDEEKVIAALGSMPYPDLMDDASLSAGSRVYCFVSMPPG